MLNKYNKGSRVERDLIRKFDSAGFSVIRAAGSGVSTLSPDILVFRKGYQYAFEVKAWESNNLTIKKSQFEGLMKWQENAGITAYVVWKRNNEQFLFIPLVVFKKTSHAYTIGWTRAKLIGRTFDEMIAVD